MADSSTAPPPASSVRPPHHSFGSAATDGSAAITVVLPSQSITLRLNVTAATTVQQLKKLIQDECPGKPAPTGQRLIWKGRFLRDEETLDEVVKASLLTRRLVGIMTNAPWPWHRMQLAILLYTLLFILTLGWSRSHQGWSISLDHRFRHCPPSLRPLLRPQALPPPQRCLSFLQLPPSTFLSNSLFTSILTPFDCSPTNRYNHGSVLEISVPLSGLRV